MLDQLKIAPETLAHIEKDIKAAEEELDDDAESIITNERYVYIASIIKACYKKKSVGQLSTSDKIDKVVTNRWLGLPIFAVVMFLVYYIAMVAVGAPATDWANDGVFGDGWHLLWIGSAEYNDADGEYSDALNAINGFVEIDPEAEDFDAAAALEAIKNFKPDSDNATGTVTVEDEETLAQNDLTVYYSSVPESEKNNDAVVQMSFLEAKEYFETKNAEFAAPDPADFGVWVPGIPTLIGDALRVDSDDPVCPEWLSGLILDGIVAGVGAVLGFVPQMLVLFLLLAFLEACGYMARIAFVLDRIFRKFGLSGKSFIPMLIGVGCGVPGIMASRTIENERDRRMTIMTTTFIPCGAKVPFIGMIAGALFGGSALCRYLRLLHRYGCHHRFRYHAEEDQDVLRRACSLRYGASRLPLADSQQRSPLNVGTRLVLHQESRHDHHSFPPSLSGSPLTSELLTARSECSRMKRSTNPFLPLSAV